MTTTTTTKFSVQIFPTALAFTVFFFILKLVNVLPFDWIWVFSPILLAVAVFVLFLLIAAVVIGFVALAALLVAIKSK